MANVLGSRPTGWWRDRAGATRNFCAQVRSAVTAGRVDPPVVLVVEGAARPGIGEGTSDGVRVVHAPGSGDDAIVALVADCREPAALVSADRELRERVSVYGVDSVGPSWLLDRLESG